MTMDSLESEASTTGGIAETVIAQIFDLWVDAELQRRGGGLSRADIGMALVEFPPGSAPIVKINDEVALQARAVATADIAPGTAATPDNIGSLDEIWPVEVGEDSGWVAYFVLGDEAYAAFDLRYNKGRALNLLTMASEYVEAASLAALRPAADMLFSAAELTVHAQMLGQAQVTRVHGARGNWLERNEELGNTPGGFFDVLQRLHRERAAARYGDGVLTLTEEERAQFVHIVEDMIAFANSRIGKTPTK